MTIIIIIIIIIIMSSSKQHRWDSYREIHKDDRHKEH